MEQFFGGILIIMLTSSLMYIKVISSYMFKLCLNPLAFNGNNKQCSSCRDPSASLHASHVCHLWRLASREIQSRGSSWVHTLKFFFTLSHTLPLHDSHLNTRFLNAKLQANLARNKSNKMIESIQPYNLPFWLLPLHDSHLNTRFLNAELQAKLAQNKANKMVD